MKVVFPKNETNGSSKLKLKPPLPLEVAPATEEDATKMATFKLRTTPADANSPVYTHTMRKLDGSETLRQAIQFCYDIDTVITGLHITNATNAKAIYLQLLSGQALTQFNSGFEEAKITEHKRLMLEEYETRIGAGDDEPTARTAMNAIRMPGDSADFLLAGLHAIVTYIAPHKALNKQKRWMRRVCRKPADMSFREFSTGIKNINDREIVKLPPFGGTAQKLNDDEFIDIILHGIPRSWTREMEKQDFDPDEKTLTEVLHFCERMEEAEDFEPGRDAKKTNNNKKSKTDKKEKSSGGNKYCLLHGNNHTHNTDDCLVLKKQANNLRHNNDDGDKKPAFKNKTWKRDADKNTAASKKELAAFVRKQARKELYSFAKKRKAQEESSEDDDDTKSAASLNNMEEGELDLSAFNFQDMDNLKIDSDDDISV